MIYEMKGKTRASCGCTFWKDREYFVLDPCSDPLCKVRQFVYEESKKQGKEIKFALRGGPYK